VSVIEPFRAKPFIKNAKLLPLRRGDGIAVEVTHDDGSKELIGYNPQSTWMKFADVATPAHVAVNVTNAAGRITRTFRAFTSATDETAFDYRPTTGTVAEVLPLRCGVIAKLSPPPLHSFEPRTLVGQVLHFKNGNYRTAHTIASAQSEGDDVVITFTDDILVGTAKIDAIEQQALITSTAMPLAPTYRGTTLCDELFRLSVPVKSVENGRIELASPLPSNHNLKPGDKIWLSNVGVGDTIDIPLIRWTQEESKP
jgi:hypothetical protein